MPTFVRPHVEQTFEKSGRPALSRKKRGAAARELLTKQAVPGRLFAGHRLVQFPGHLLVSGLQVGLPAVRAEGRVGSRSFGLLEVDATARRMSGVTWRGGRHSLHDVTSKVWQHSEQSSAACTRPAAT